MPTPKTIQNTGPGTTGNDASGGLPEDPQSANSQPSNPGPGTASPQNPTPYTSIPYNVNPTTPDSRAPNPKVDLNAPIPWFCWFVVGGPLVRPAPKLRNFIRMTNERNAVTRKANDAKFIRERAAEEKKINEELRKFHEKYG
ncbi:uncharacterized protein F4822DRAFT_445103 [Hypoxylon trugodes]|uniref:uncharacterized protein n=1 Tax=Hypoxylon trugodes TaxID=326681 RepID=UPI00219F1FEA|nr:uncharacterized protein F4822DRAFT_445103 [Hypoxylon trugodes]KAI1386970.1 hypothetical protein F4822DRAFT_445103 [Hypoxylon trugodes]